MTALKLFLYIATGIFLQITFFAGMAFYRHWLVYQQLKSQLAGFNAELANGSTQDRSVVNGTDIGQGTAWTGLREFRVQRKVFEDAIQSVCSFYLVPTDGKPLPPFKPGQYLTFQLDIPDGHTGQSRAVVRCYSLSDRPGMDYYRVSIKRLPAGISSSTFHEHIHEGSLLLANAPRGHFFLEEGNAPIVLVAGGIGITPLLSMINDHCNRGITREIWLFYGVRNSGEQIMKDHLQNLAARHPQFRLHLCYSQPLPNDVLGRDFQHRGHVDITLLRLTLLLKPYQFYVCGPRAMMESLIPALGDWGVPDQHLHYETFGPASLSRSARNRAMPTKPITVTFSQSGKSLIWDEEADSLLQFAERHGIEVASGCRAGGCGMCQTAIQSGAVDYAKSPDFDPKPGHCLLCISRPQRDLTLLA